MRRLIAMCLCLLAAGAVLAEMNTFSEPSGTLYRTWLSNGGTLEYSASYDGGVTFSPTRELFSFTAEVTTYDFKAEHNNFYLAYGSSNEVNYLSSSNQGNSWQGAKKIRISGEALSLPGLSVDELGQPHLIFISRNINNQLQKICYLNLSTDEVNAIFSTQDRITQPKIAASPSSLLITWANGYLDRADNFFAVSLDGGRHFGPAMRGQALPPITTPAITAPYENLAVNSRTVEVKCLTTGQYPVMIKTDLSTDKAFPPQNTWSYSFLNFSGSPEAAFPLPFDIPDGVYFIRVAAFDGFALSTYSKPFAFKIDRQPPLIQLISPTGETSNDGDIMIQGKLNKNATISLNGRPLTLEAGNIFSLNYSLQAGQNLFTFIATDETGSQTILSKTMFFSSIFPRLKILKPLGTDWFRPGAACLVEATVTSGAAPIEDEIDGEILINGKAATEKLTYEKSEGVLSGFITLPLDLTDGQANIRLRLTDSAGKTGEKEFIVNLDRTPPLLALDADKRIFTNSLTEIHLPLRESGCGVDPASSLVKIEGISFEVSGSGEALLLKPSFPLSKPGYSGQIVARDLLGNTSEATAFTLIVDTTPPRLSVFIRKFDNNILTITGEANDNYLAAICIYDNGHSVDSFLPASPKYVREINLQPGENQLMVEAVDRAGNKTACSFSPKANSVKANAVFTSFSNAPNPFSPGQDGQMYFTYTVPAIFTLKVYIFDLAGTLIWKKEVSNTNAPNNLSWNGYDHFGRLVNNGLYPYVLAVESGGQTEIKRGKIIVLQ